MLVWSLLWSHLSLAGGPAPGGWPAPPATGTVASVYDGDTITLSGLRPYEDIDIVFTGVRAGEKLFEELNTADEHAARTYHPKIFTGKIAAYTGEQVAWALEQLARLAAEGQTEEIYHFLQDFLPEACLTSQRAVALPRLVPELRAAKTQAV